MTKRGIIKAGLAVAVYGAFSWTAMANEYQEFFDVKGRKIEAKLLSHKGDGKVKIETKAGKKFDVDITTFGKLDQQLIKDWVAKTPPSIDYNFAVDMKEDRSDSETRKTYSKRIKTITSSYEVKLTSKSRDVANDLTLAYKVFMFNEAEGNYGATSSSRGLYQHMGEVKMEKQMGFNDYITFKTKPFLLEEVDYDYYSDNSHYKDRLVGVMIRVKNADGKVVWEYKSDSKELVAQTWDGKKKAPAKVNGVTSARRPEVSRPPSVEQPKKVN